MPQRNEHLGVFPPSRNSNSPKFVADVMVGKLSRWLRVLGFDVAYSNTYPDEEIVRIAESENRIILTRYTGISARPICSECLLIESGAYKEHPRQALPTFTLHAFKL